jgi:hypothetical protein
MKAFTKRKPLRVGIPRFIAKEEIGLGDMISRMTSTIGIKPCAACKKRAAALNEKVVFGRRGLIPFSASAAARRGPR